jgi:hypothetical protein
MAKTAHERSSIKAKWLGPRPHAINIHITIHSFLCFDSFLLRLIGKNPEELVNVKKGWPEMAGFCVCALLQTKDLPFFPVFAEILLANGNKVFT